MERRLTLRLAASLRVVAIDADCPDFVCFDIAEAGVHLLLWRVPDEHDRLCT